MITKVEFWGNSKGKFLCYSNVVIENQLAIKGIKLVQKQDGGILIAMPSKKKTSKVDDGNYRETHEDVVYPINREFRALLENRILEEYKNHG